MPSPLLSQRQPRRCVLRSNGLPRWLAGPNNARSRQACRSRIGFAHQRAIQGREAWETFGDWIDRNNPRFAFEIADNFLRGMRVEDTALTAAREFQAARRRELLEMLAPDMIVCLPTAPFPAPPLRQPRSTMWAKRTAISTLTSIAGTLGAPQLSLPVAFVDGLPVGLSLLGRPGADEMLLAFARALPPDL